jgi:hypothetical protein
MAYAKCNQHLIKLSKYSSVLLHTVFINCGTASRQFMRMIAGEK